MPLTIEIPDEIAVIAGRYAEETGADTSDVILETLRARFQPLPDDLAQEIRWWESASESDIAEFNRNHGL